MAGRDFSRGCQPVPGCLCDCAIWRKQSELSQAGRGPGRENVGGGRRKSCGVGSAARLFLLARPSLLRDIERAMRFSGRAPQQRGVFRVVEKSHDPQTLLGPSASPAAGRAVASLLHPKVRSRRSALRHSPACPVRAGSVGSGGSGSAAAARMDDGRRREKTAGRAANRSGRGAVRPAGWARRANGSGGARKGERLRVTF